MDVFLAYLMEVDLRHPCAKPIEEQNQTFEDAQILIEAAGDSALQNNNLLDEQMWQILTGQFQEFLGGLPLVGQSLVTKKKC